MKGTRSAANPVLTTFPPTSPLSQNNSRRKRPLTAAEQAEVADARARAAAAAEARQARYAQTAVGKATAKAVADARKPAAPPGRGDTRAADWLS
jgi:hypothetical protein